MSGIRRRLFGTFIGLALAGAHCIPSVQAQTVTLCAESGEAIDRIAGLTPDFTTQSAIRVRIVRRTPTIFERDMRILLLARNHACDVVILPLHMLGWAAENSLLLELTTFQELGELKFDAFLPAAIHAYSTWPKNGNAKWSLPATIDTPAWVYRQDWFARNDIQSAFRQRFKRDIGPPANWSEFRELVEFFNGREIGDRRVEGARILTDADRSGLSPSAIAFLLSHGTLFENADSIPDAFVESDAVAALESYHSIARCCRDLDPDIVSASRDLNAFASGRVAMMMIWMSSVPELAAAIGPAKIGYFSGPRARVNATLLDGSFLAVVAGSPRANNAIRLLKWFATPELQLAYWARGGFSAHEAIFRDARQISRYPFAAVYLEAIAAGRPFWQVPAASEMRVAFERELAKFVYSDTGSAARMLDAVTAEWLALVQDTRPAGAAIPRLQRLPRRTFQDLVQ